MCVPEGVKKLDVELTITKSDGLSNWYLIERKEHDGRVWLERTGPNSGALMCSSRIGNADVEGTLEEMLELARAIMEGGEKSFRRCAAVTVPDGVLFYSPRNSIEVTLFPRERAVALALQILALTPPALEKLVEEG